MLVLYVLLLARLSTSRDLNPKGPVHQDIATKCLMEVVKMKIPTMQMITVITQKKLETPGFETQRSIIKALNEHGNYTLEITDGNRLEFTSTEWCVNCPTTETEIYKKSFKLVVKSNLLFIIDNTEIISEMIENINNMTSFDVRKVFLIFYTKVEADCVEKVKEALTALYLNNMHHAAILIPTNLTHFELYTYDLYPKNAIYCGASPEITYMNSCNKGVFTGTKFAVRDTYTNLNCTVNTILMKTPPFVIDEENGVEINLLNEFSRKMNISCNKSLDDHYGDWGSKVNGSWTGLLGHIYDDLFNMGLGYATSNSERYMDFEFTDNYIVENVVWVVPSAAKLPQWKGIVTVFEFPLWSALFAVMISFAIGFYVLSNYYHDEYNYLKMYGAAMVISLQLIIGSSAKSQPKKRVVRVLFITLALFSILIISLYQGGLIYVMTNPRYETQIDSEDAVFESGIGIGGIGAYRAIFNETNNQQSLRIFNNFEIYADVNDTMYQWLLTVAQDRDTITILGEMYVKYLITKRDKGVVNHDLSPKVYIVKDALFANQVRVVFSKGFPLKLPFNKIIKRLTYGGLFNKWMDDYLSTFRKDENAEGEDDDHEHDDAVVITVKHLEGHFALLIVGAVISTIAFIIEHIAFRITMSKHFKMVEDKLRRKQKAVGRWNMIQKQTVKARVVKNFADGVKGGVKSRNATFKKMNWNVERKTPQNATVFKRKEVEKKRIQNKFVEKELERAIHENMIKRFSTSNLTLRNHIIVKPQK